MNPSKHLFAAGAVLVASFATALISKGNVEGFSPPRPPASIPTIHLPANVDTGLIRLRLVIDPSGRPKKITVLSRCDPVVERRLLPALSKCRFTPAIENGQAVEAEVILPLDLVELSEPAGNRL